MKNMNYSRENFDNTTNKINEQEELIEIWEDPTMDENDPLVKERQAQYIEGLRAYHAHLEKERERLLGEAWEEAKIENIRFEQDKAKKLDEEERIKELENTRLEFNGSKDVLGTIDKELAIPSKTLKGVSELYFDGLDADGKFDMGLIYPVDEKGKFLEGLAVLKLDPETGEISGLDDIPPQLAYLSESDILKEISQSLNELRLPNGQIITIHQEEIIQAQDQGPERTAIDGNKRRYNYEQRKIAKIIAEQEGFLFNVCFDDQPDESGDQIHQSDPDDDLFTNKRMAFIFENGFILDTHMPTSSIAAFAFHFNPPLPLDRFKDLKEKYLGTTDPEKRKKIEDEMTALLQETDYERILRMSKKEQAQIGRKFNHPHMRDGNSELLPEEKINEKNRKFYHRIASYINMPEQSIQ